MQPVELRTGNAGATLTAVEVSTRAYARAGLLGNPSDGYYGKTLAVIVDQFAATVTLRKSSKLRIVPAADDLDEFESLEHLSHVVDVQGFYGGSRLLKASLKAFHDFCGEYAKPASPAFEISYSTNIPRGVGLAGSSAIIIAAIRALEQHYAVELEPEVRAALALNVEALYLKIPAGLQDRVIQSFEGLVFMDFSRDKMATVNNLSIGVYSPLSTSLLPPLYVAYSGERGEPTEVLHSDLKRRFATGDRQVLEAMTTFAELAEQGRAALLAGNQEEFSKLMDRNFDLRKSICELNRQHCQMVEAARSVGASAKFCGSGGAIVGVFSSEDMFRRLEDALQRIRCPVLRLQPATSVPD